MGALTDEEEYKCRLKRMIGDARRFEYFYHFKLKNDLSPNGEYERYVESYIKPLPLSAKEKEALKKYPGFEEAIRVYKKAKTEFKERSLHALDLDYRKRKIVMPVYFFSDIVESPLLIDIDEKLPIEFPMGHPLENHLYVGHPLIPKKYIPFESYQLELVEDRVREFCILAQSLGATEISIECLNTSNSDRYTDGRTSFSAQGGNKLFSGSAGVDYQYSRRMIEELSRSISLRQTYEPCDKPSVPNGLVWYSNEPSWQRLVTQRMSGGLKSHEERIETKKCQVIDSRELLNLKANVEALWGKVGMNFTNEDNQKFTQQENAVLSIKVKFASLREIEENRRNR